MKKFSLIISVLLIITSFKSYNYTSDKFILVKENVVYLLNFNDSFSSRTGSDGVKITYPYGWSTREGSDGRKIAYPYGWSTREGSDGRKIAYPYGWSTTEGSDGRKIAYPYGWSTTEGSDGRKIAYPYGWSTREGSDGRIIAYPYGWSIKNVNGRLYPEIQQTENGGLAIIFAQLENSEKIKQLIDDNELDIAFDYTSYLLINDNY